MSLHLSSGKLGYKGYVTSDYFHSFARYPEALIYRSSDALDCILRPKA